jgi:hypothetical protein
MIATAAIVSDSTRASWAVIDPAAITLPRTHQVDLTSFVVAAQSVE